MPSVLKWENVALQLSQNDDFGIDILGQSQNTMY